ncbi:hypothetical protein M8494_00310 [Serratia ureilytica]
MALLSPIGTAYARDYFNPALLEIDNPSCAAPISPYLRRTVARRPGTIGSIFT